MSTSWVYPPGTTDDFDFICGLFASQATRPRRLGAINLRTLSPFQRALVFIDGTVTKFIEAYTMEPVEIVRLGQLQRHMSEANAWLDIPEGTLAVARQVLLRGQYSHTLYAYAASLIVPERLEDAVKQSLDLEGAGLGSILLNSQVESRREVLWYGKEDATSMPRPVRDVSNDEFISRSYRIIAGQQPLMLINEKFPFSVDLLPSQE